MKDLLEQQRQKRKISDILKENSEVWGVKEVDSPSPVKNVLGGLLIGFVMGKSIKTNLISPHLKLFLTTEISVKSLFSNIISPTTLENSVELIGNFLSALWELVYN